MDSAEDTKIEAMAADKEATNIWLNAAMRIKGYEGGGLAGWAYTGNCDSKPLAGALLMLGNPPPEILELLGVLLLGGGKGGLPRLTLKASKGPRRVADLIEKAKKHAEARKIYDDLIDSGKVRKQAIWEICRRLGVKETWVEGALRGKDEDMLQMLYNGALAESVQRRRPKNGSKV